MAELLATIDGAVFVERVSLDSPANVRKAKKAVKKAFEVQQKRLASALWKSCRPVRPTGAMLRQSTGMDAENMIPYYPLGNLKCPEEVRE
jgi:2-oxoglutarate ferredoxin oxidoreductase subunit beta